MARNKTAAQRRARKAKKRAERKHRRPRAQVPSFAEAAALIGERFDEDLAWLEEVDPEPCSAATAEARAEDCVSWAYSMSERALAARVALEQWREDARTTEFRRLLEEFARETAATAARLHQLAAHFDDLAAREDRHVHLVDGRLVDPDQPRAEEDVDIDADTDDIPY